MQREPSRGPTGRVICGGLLTQGIGLRPHPWAGFSRPVGPVPGGHFEALEVEYCLSVSTCELRACEGLVHDQGGTVTLLELP